jgi:flagellum-specific peptidoglycan hydrolase FlgJ
MNCFASWEDLDTAARDHVALLFRRFPKAVEAAKKGDATAYVRELKKAGYFTGSEEEYSKVVNSIAKSYTKKLELVMLPTVVML